MAELLLINPRKRRATAKRKTAKRRVRRNPIAVAAAPKRRVARRRNPIGLGRVARRARRRNPIGGGLKMGGIVAQLKQAAIGGAGAFAVDVAMGYAEGYLPASMRNSTTSVNSYDALKLAATIALGEVLNKPTKGLSRKMAMGAMTVQSYYIMSKLVPTGTFALAGVGYASPANIVRGSNRVNPIMSRMNAYTRPGVTPLLSAYQKPGNSPMLNGGANLRAREGVKFR